MAQESGGSFRRALLLIFATIGVVALLSVGSCVALVGWGISTLSNSFSTGNSAHLRASTNNISFSVPNKDMPYIAGIKFNSEINSAFADDVISKLQYAAHDSNAIGVLLEVDSPGGVVVPSQEIYDAVKELAATKPVVSYVRSVAASGAYYSIAPSSEIIASRGSLIGSIGVIMQGFEVNELLKFLKIQPTTLKTGALKDAGSPFRPMTPADKDYLNSLINQMFEIFMDDIKKVRPAISQKDLNFMTDGRVLLAQQAQAFKLIDLIGSKDLAKTELIRLTQTKSKPDVFYYDDLKPFADFFAEKFISSSSQVVKELFINQNNLPK